MIEKKEQLFNKNDQVVYHSYAMLTITSVILTEYSPNTRRLR